MKPSKRLLRHTPLRARTGLRRGRLRSVNPERRKKRFAQQFGSTERVRWYVAHQCVSCGTSAKPRQYSHYKHGPCKTAAEGVPQCADCHREIHDKGIETHQRRRGVDLEAEAARFDQMWREHSGR